MSVMTETITRHVSEYVKRAMEAANSARPLPYFDYVPTAGCEPSHRQRGSRRHLGQSGLDDPIQGIMIGTRLRRSGQVAAPSRGKRPSPPQPPLPMQLTPGELPDSMNKSRLQASMGGLGLNGHTTTECHELKKALHELADKGQIDRFLKRGPRFLRRE
ncbi:hypothetical protein Cgig2_027446 [Carnegiea gigantea]|uniref:Uncharacterized protein n=1 Tax=Carnegiea gigantea TaxID=171969 RepID=A0A9Q1GM75_9CARY|nr:hypothetical protein Cgig2_027446 [Carnegiea gigantea]